MSLSLAKHLLLCFDHSGSLLINNVYPESPLAKTLLFKGGTSDFIVRRVRGPVKAKLVRAKSQSGRRILVGIIQRSLNATNKLDMDIEEMKGVEDDPWPTNKKSLAKRHAGEGEDD